MDTRGIELTNQLRSAIRAKLMELGVRYDEELPDYILVMVVNKKSRQQMHDDLNLFLEDSTTVFVDWLHDQVLKKLQRITVAKKKSSREFVPTVVVKQEEERKKRKISATSFLEDQGVEPPVEKSAGKSVTKDDKPVAQKQQTVKPSIPDQDLEQSHNRNAEKNNKNILSKIRTEEALINIIEHQDNNFIISSKISPQQQQQQQQNSARDEITIRETVVSESSTARIGVSHRDQRSGEAPGRSLKRSLETSSGHHDTAEKRDHETRQPKSSEEEKEEAASLSSPDVAKKLKSYVNKPKITSVVSVKNRLGVVSTRKKFQVYREKTSGAESSSRGRQSNKRFDKHRYDNARSGSFQRNRNFETDERSRRNRDGSGSESRHHETNKPIDVRSRIEISKNERLGRNFAESFRERINSNSKTVNAPKKSISTIKDRLGVPGKIQKQSAKSQDNADYRNSKSSEQARDSANNAKNIKNRLGPLKNNFRPVCKSNARLSRGSEDDDCLNLGADEEEEELDNDEDSLAGPLKSHIVAVNRPAIARLEKKRSKASEVPFNAATHSGYLGHGAKSQSDKVERKASSDMDDEDTEDTKLPSKVIVTPRPLKPLQPTQKRATQSLLLRAVAEANQSVVKQKNPEPSLDKKPVLKRLRPASTRDVSQNLSVHLNSSKRLVMEKIQIELNTADNQDVEEAEPAPYVPQAVTDEHMGVMMSLFQRSDDTQKFLVTLNGYNNNHMKEMKVSSEDDEEQLEMEVNEDDELALLTTHNETYTTQNSSGLENEVFRITDDTEDDMETNSPKEVSEENNENCNTENVEKTDEVPRKRRKLSPIIYNRSHSPSPTQPKSTTLLLPTLTTKPADKKLPVENVVPVTILDKSKENCRYWPNCTLGNKCAYFHPSVMCSAFPACKFGDKCAYKHPKCKFGLSCTKLGCVFSHPSQQCKYHPFCTKPACPYSHPSTSSHVPLVTETTSQRAKFTWRRRD